MFDMNRIGKTIARLRREHNMTQVALADQMGVSYQAVSLWETGKSMPDIAKLPDLAAVFGVTIDDLLGQKAPVVSYAIEGELPERTADGTVSADDLVQAAPILPPDQINDAVQRLADRTNIAALLPFLNTETVDEMMAAQAQSGQDIRMYLPFASEDAIDRMMMEQARAGHAICEYFPFASEDVIDQLMMEQARAGHAICEYFPFASEDVIDRMMMEQAQAGHDVSAYLPFASEDVIDQLMMEQAQAGHDVNAYLPFASEDAVSQAALTCLSQNRGIDAFFPFLPEDFLSDLAKAASRR